MTVKKVGRPTVMTQIVLGKLEYAFSCESTDVQACNHAGINPDTLYQYCKDNPEFSERKAALKEDTGFHALVAQNEAIKKRDMPAVQKYLDRKHTQKINHDITSAGKPLNNWIVMPVTTDKGPGYD